MTLFVTLVLNLIVNFSVSIFIDGPQTERLTDKFKSNYFRISLLYFVQVFLSNNGSQKNRHYICIVYVEMFKFSDQNFVNQTWSQNQELRCTMCKNSNEWRHTAIFTDKIKFTHYSYNIHNWIEVHFTSLPICIMLIINKISPKDCWFRKRSNEWYWIGTDYTTVSPVVEVPS